VIKSFRPETGDGGRLPTGFYFLGLDSPEVRNNNPFDDFRLLIVADANLTFKTSTTDGLLWLTDLENGRPVAGAALKIYDDHNAVLAEGKTDADGMFHTTLPEPPEGYGQRFAISEDENAFGFASSGWGSGVNVWDYGIWSDYYAPTNRPVAYVYTERPIYRPGQPVYFKGIVRRITTWITACRMPAR
jgi:uncharacterized protein YfaS (alpha-2-macroglobulin family)